MMTIPEIAKVQEFFNFYVFGYMCKDIEREIDLARSGNSAGNFLCALGLLCYTEFMGGLYFDNFKEWQSRKRFEKFFDYMGKEYKDFRTNPTAPVDVYKIFRCGLAHEYFVKKPPCDIVMLNGPDTLTQPHSHSMQFIDRSIKFPIKIGLGTKMDQGHFVGRFFVVEKYYEDFRAACVQLNSKIIQDKNRVFNPDIFARP